MIKLLIGGSPCTYWSIAQKNNRETKAEGLGWELFKNYLIAKEKFKPDFFLYENNKSAAQAIKDQIKKELKVWDGTLFMEDSGARYIEINSALVSAQNRQRFYVHNCGEVEQPEDRGILLRDILESGQRILPYGNEDKSRPVNALYPNNAGLSIEKRIYSDNPNKQQIDFIAEPIGATNDGKALCLCARYNGSTPKHTIEKSMGTMVAEPVENVGNCETIQKAIPKLIDKYGYLPEQFNAYNLAEITDKSPTLSTGSMVTSSCATTIFEKTDKPIYEVKDGKITIKGKQYPIKLADGFYIIRKLTVTECCRLQTMPEIEHCLYINFNTGDIIQEKCLDLQKTNAQYAGEKCHKLQKFAKSVQEIDLLEFAQFVGNNTNIKLQQINEPVLLSVHTSLEELSNQKDYSKELLKNANIAEKNLSYLNQEQTEIFAQSIVGITTMLRKTTQIGMVELHLKDKIFAVVKDGKMQFMLCGTEIMQLVRDAEINMSKVKKAITFTTLEVFPNSEICEQILTTLFCYVLNAIGGYILQKTNGEILLKIKTPYTYAVSNAQAYKGLGNGWTAEVIIHILNGALKSVPKDEEIIVLSMYDGIGTGRYCLDKMGFTNVKYYAYEIDKYAKQIAMSNYPDIIQMGDAFDLRKDEWRLY